MQNSNRVDLFLLRHGTAQERSFTKNDSNRPLTNEGRIKTTKILKKLKLLGFQSDRIISSPYLRAIETGQLAFKVGLGKNFDISKSLEPLGDPFTLLGELSGKNMFVGHEPSLSLLACSLINANSNSIILKKAGLIHLRWNKDESLDSTRLICLLKPSFLEQI